MVCIGMVIFLQAALKRLQQQGLQALPASSSDPRSVKQVRQQPTSLSL